MSQTEQIEHFAKELHALITRFRAEYELTLAGAVGAMEVVKLELFAQESQ